MGYEPTSGYDRQPREAAALVCPQTVPSPFKYPSLDKADARRIVENLADALTVFQNRKSPMNVPEIQLKSMLIALKRELEEHIATLPDPEALD
ncbi:MAG: hypothetical protein JWQ62_1260 [Lacunisphaera sp.]|nr:hypothetical protein [Lacunisphaera sp.]